MNKKYRRVPTRLGPQVGFGVKPNPSAQLSAEQKAEFERLKARLLAEQLPGPGETQKDSTLRRAANEAAALAWVSQYPLLVFPVLFAEKAEAALFRAERQEQIRQRSQELLAA
jgi:hypothetical protein